MERGFEFLEKELAELDPQPDEEKDSQFADKLVKVYHRDGVEEWGTRLLDIKLSAAKKLLAKGFDMPGPGRLF